MFDDNNNQEEQKNIPTQNKQVLSLQDVQNMTFTEPIQEEVSTNPIQAVLDSTIDKDEQISLKKRKHRNILRRIVRISEFVILVVVFFVLRSKYLYYSSHVKQILTYKSSPYVYEIKRTNYDFYVTKYEEYNCREDNTCDTKPIDNYKVVFDDTRMLFIRTYFDLLFKFQDNEKIIKYIDLRTELARRSIRSIITNDYYFISTERYKDYRVISFEQKSEFVSRGFYYKEQEGSFYVDIALGHKYQNGYSLEVTEAHLIDDDIVFYVTEAEPAKPDKWQNENNPVLYLELNRKPKELRVVNIKNGEQFKYLGSPDIIEIG